ncbi:MAG: ATP-binding protein [Acidobacteriota bacterium]
MIPLHASEERILRRDYAEQSRVLIVDDEMANLKVLKMVLEFDGYRHVECVNDSREALPAVLRFQPDLILLDLHMPHMDGMDILESLHGILPGDDYVPVLVLTGDNTSGAKEKALARGASDFLNKPLSHTEVGLRVGNLLKTRWLHRQLREQNQFLEQQVRERTELAATVSATSRQLRETQAHLVQSEKMGALGQLVAGIAHEINNPLAFVLNSAFVAEDLMGRLAGEVQVSLATESQARWAKARRCLGDVRVGAERVKELVSKLRTFSRLDEGQFKTVNIHESIESVLLFLQHKAEGRITIVRDFQAPDMLHCYAGELNQVWMNLVANAIDAIKGPGVITISTRHQDGYFVATVRDTGQGIPQESRHKVFDPFYTTKPVGEGTGLGLAISYGVVQAHKGSIDFQSEPGQGTEFTLRIPLSIEADAIS